ADYFTYAVSFAALAAGASAQGNIQIQADSDFIWKQASFYADDDNVDPTFATLPYLPVNVQITDSGSGRNLFNQALPVPAVFGTGQLPNILPRDRILRARSNITFAVENFSPAGTPFNFTLCLIGEKIFKMQGKFQRRENPLTFRAIE